MGSSSVGLALDEGDTGASEVVLGEEGAGGLTDALAVAVWI
ncbi:hypothetical protein [Micrococcus sp. IITD107]